MYRTIRIRVNSVAEAFVDCVYEGDLEDAPSDPEYLSLVLDNFNTDDLEYMPGSSVLVTNDKFSEGIYTVLYAMLGFDVD